MDKALQEEDNADDRAGTILFESTNTDVSLEYVTELQTKVSSAMTNHEMPFVISSAVYENPYRLHVVVTSNAEEDLQKLLDLDMAGGALEIEYSRIQQIREGVYNIPGQEQREDLPRRAQDME